VKKLVKVSEAFNRYSFVYCAMSVAEFMLGVKRHGVVVRILRESDLGMQLC